MRKSERRLSLNRNVEQASSLPSVIGDSGFVVLSASVDTLQYG